MRDLSFSPEKEGRNDYSDDKIIAIVTTCSKFCIFKFVQISSDDSLKTSWAIEEVRQKKPSYSLVKCIDF